MHPAAPKLWARYSSIPIHAASGLVALALAAGLVRAASGSAEARDPGIPSAEVVSEWCRTGVDPTDAFQGRAAEACGHWLRHIVGLDAETMDIGYLWVLRKLLDRDPEPEIEAFVGSWKPAFQAGRGSIVYPDVPRRWLPKDPGEGLERFHNWVSAPSGRPASRAIRFIDAYTSIEAEGYVLTHQFFVLVWAEDVGLELPGEVRARKGDVLERIRAEHAADPRPGDLDFERTLILLLYADVDGEDARRWIARMLEAWDGDARRWTFEGRETIRFQGRSFQMRHGPHHPTAMALGGVKTYLDRFAARAGGEAER